MVRWERIPAEGLESLVCVELAMATRARKIPLKRKQPQQPELPPKVARDFIFAMQAYFAERDGVKRDQIAVLQLRSLQDHWPGKLRLQDVQAMFHQMRDEAVQ
jgi:hypothetical protein